MQSITGGFKFLLIVSVALILLKSNSITSQVEAVVIGDCGGEEAGATLTYIEVENCGEKDPYCPFIRGTNASMEVAFKTKTPFTSTKVDISGSFSHISKHFPINPDDACGNYGFNCPVGANEDKTLKLVLPVKNFYPAGLKVDVVFKLLNENKKNIFCVTFPAKIESQGQEVSEVEIQQHS